MIIPPIRGTDNYGSGYFKAPRGDHLHTGVDRACYPGSRVMSLTPGTVTKLGYTYADDLSYRYVEITLDGNRFRYYYITPSVAVGDVISTGDELGVVQDLAKRYPNGIISHYHFEIINPSGEYVNPSEMFGDLI